MIPCKICSLSSFLLALRPSTTASFMYSLLGVGGHLSDITGEHLYFALRSADNRETASEVETANEVRGGLPETNTSMI